MLVHRYKYPSLRYCTQRCATSTVKDMILFPRHFKTMSQTSMKLFGNSGRTYRLIEPLDSRRTSPSPAVWRAVDDKDEDQEYVIKQPKDYDPEPDYPSFKHEAEMQRLLSDSPFIRKMVDWIPAPTTSKKPAMVLQAFERTLWDARWSRPLTKAEIKWTMKAVLLGIWTIHRKGLVYTGKFKPKI